MTTELIAKELEGVTTADATGAFEIIFASKRDDAGELVIDKQGDVYADGAVGGQRVSIGCLNHGSCDGPAGSALTFETEKDIRARGSLDLSTEHGRYQYDVWKALGERAEFSYSFGVNDSETTVVNRRQVRMLKSLRVVSIDLVQAPAGNGTRIISLKSACECDGTCDSCDGETSTDDHEMLKRERDRFNSLQGRASVAEERTRFRQLTEQPKAAQEGVFNWAEVTPPLETRAATLLGVGKAMDVFNVDTLLRIRFFKRAGAGDSVAFSTAERVAGMGDKSKGIVWIHADLEGDNAALAAYHEVTHVARPKMSESQVEQEERYFASTLNSIRPDYRALVSTASAG